MLDLRESSWTLNDIRERIARTHDADVSSFRLIAKLLHHRFMVVCHSRARARGHAIRELIENEDGYRRMLSRFEANVLPAVQKAVHVLPDCQRSFTTLEDALRGIIRLHQNLSDQLLKGLQPEFPSEVGPIFERFALYDPMPGVYFTFMKGRELAQFDRSRN
jgi:hypothetical protein